MNKPPPDPDKARKPSRRARTIQPTTTRVRVRREGCDAPSPFDEHSELQAFATWFADWWLRRGRDLTLTSKGATHE
jgi:hypothetical protein